MNTNAPVLIPSKTFRGHASPVYSLSFSICGEFVASGEELNGICYVREAASGKMKHMIDENYEYVTALFAPNGHVLAIGSFNIDRPSDCGCSFWDVDSAEYIGSITNGWFDQHGVGLRVKQNGVSCLSYSSGGDEMAVGGHDGRIGLWQLKKGLSNTTTKTIDCRSFGKTSIRCIYYESDDSSLIAGMDSGALVVVDRMNVPVVNLIKKFDTPVISIAPSAHRHEVWVANANSIELLEIFSGKCLMTHRIDCGSVDQIATCASAELLLVSGRSPRLLRTGDLTTMAVLEDQSGCVRLGAFSPTYSTIATGHDNGDVCLWKFIL